MLNESIVIKLVPGTAPRRPPQACLKEAAKTLARFRMGIKFDLAARQGVLRAEQLIECIDEFSRGDEAAAGKVLTDVGRLPLGSLDLDKFAWFLDDLMSHQASFKLEHEVVINKATLRDLNIRSNSGDYGATGPFEIPIRPIDDISTKKPKRKAVGFARGVAPARTSRAFNPRANFRARQVSRTGTVDRLFDAFASLFPPQLGDVAAGLPQGFGDRQAEVIVALKNPEFLVALGESSDRQVGEHLWRALTRHAPNNDEATLGGAVQVGLAYINTQVPGVIGVRREGYGDLSASIKDTFDTVASWLGTSVSDKAPLVVADLVIKGAARESQVFWSESDTFTVLSILSEGDVADEIWNAIARTPMVSLSRPQRQSLTQTCVSALADALEVGLAQEIKLDTLARFQRAIEYLDGDLEATASMVSRVLTRLSIQNPDLQALVSKAVGVDLAQTQAQEIKACLSQTKQSLLTVVQHIEPLGDAAFLSWVGRFPQAPRRAARAFGAQPKTFLGLGLERHVPQLRPTPAVLTEVRALTRVAAIHGVGGADLAAEGVGFLLHLACGLPLLCEPNIQDSLSAARTKCGATY